MFGIFEQLGGMFETLINIVMFPISLMTTIISYITVFTTSLIAVAEQYPYLTVPMLVVLAVCVVFKIFGREASS